MLEIRAVDAAHKQDARLKNEPFRLWGRIIPALRDGVWSHRVEPLAEPGWDCFPDEAYDPERDDAIFLGAYEGGECLGLAVLRRGMFRYLYLDDLKVRAAFRDRGVGGRLIEACMTLDEPSKVTRYDKVKVSFDELVDGELKPRKRDYTGWEAQMIQHMVDHCMGKLV